MIRSFRLFEIDIATSSSERNGSAPSDPIYFHVPHNFWWVFSYDFNILIGLSVASQNMKLINETRFVVNVLINDSTSTPQWFNWILYANFTEALLMKCQSSGDDRKNVMKYVYTFTPDQSETEIF